MNVGAIKDLVVETFNEWNEDKAPRLAAALAYYTIFSLAPLLVIAIAIAGAVLGTDSTRQEVINQIGGLLGPEGAQGIDAMLQAADRPREGILATVLGIITLLLGAGGLFGQLQDALNTIWEVAPRPDRGIWGMVHDRFFSFAMVLGTGFLLLVSLLLNTFLLGLGRYVAGDGFDESIIWQIVNVVVSAAVTMGLFALIFKVLPDVKIAWKDVLWGAGITTALFLLGRYLISLYLANTATSSSYGAAGSLVILLLWVYFSAQILFMGAEFTQVYARRYGSRIVPADNAVPLSEEARATQGMPRRENLEAAAKGQAPHAGAQPGTGRPAGNSATPRSGTSRGRAAPQRPAIPDSPGAAAGNTVRSGLARFAMLSGLLSLFSGRRRR